MARINPECLSCFEDSGVFESQNRCSQEGNKKDVQSGMTGQKKASPDNTQTSERNNKKRVVGRVMRLLIAASAFFSGCSFEGGGSNIAPFSSRPVVAIDTPTSTPTPIPTETPTPTSTPTPIPTETPTPTSTPTPIPTETPTPSLPEINVYYVDGTGGSIGKISRINSVVPAEIGVLSQIEEADAAVRELTRTGVELIIQQEKQLDSLIASTYIEPGKGRVFAFLQGSNGAPLLLAKAERDQNGNWSHVLYTVPDFPKKGLTVAWGSGELYLVDTERGGEDRAVIAVLEGGQVKFEEVWGTYVYQFDPENEKWERISRQKPVSLQSQATGDPAETVVLSVPLDHQDYSLSCESSAAQMAAQGVGAEVYEVQIANRIPRHYNPHRGFCGNIRGRLSISCEDPNGYGTYAEPVVEALRSFGVDAVAEYGVNYETVAEEIRNSHPVIVWVSYKENPLFEERVDPETGEIYRMVLGEHAIVVSGVAGRGENLRFLVNDPATGAQYWLKRFPNWELFDGMRVVVRGLLGK